MSSRPIFLVGCPRSGTTLLSTILHAHPKIAMAPETRFLLPTYYERERFGDLARPDNRRQLGEFIVSRPGPEFRDLGLDNDAVIQAIVDGPPTLGSAFASVWAQFARDRGAERWGEKRPLYWREMGVILRLFPTAQVIHLVRDPRSVVASLQQVPWYDRGVVDATALWIQADNELRRVGRRLDGTSYHRLRYEDLLTDPRSQLTALCAFLGEDFADEMLDHVAAARDIVPKRKTWHTRVTGPLDTSRVQAWQQKLTPADAGLIELAAWPAMRRSGYRRSAVSARPAPADVVLVMRRYLGLRKRIAQVRLADAMRRRRSPMPLEAVI